jgi:serine protease Do
MKKPIRQSKSPYILMVAGFALGAVSMAGVFNAATARPAWAQASPVQGRTISGVTEENLAALRNLDDSFANLAEFVGPAVVEIRVSNAGRRTDDAGRRAPQVAGEGSGFVYRPDGWIMTNDHVVGGFDKVTVTLKDGRTFDGKVTRAEDSDIAVVKIDAEDLPTLTIADSSKVRPGQLVMAVGAPFGLDQTVTFGHVSAIGRLQGIQNRLYPDLIQTDAAINVGNSGGPLVNVEGQVVGINTAIFSTSGVSGGVGFAIPGNQARFIADTLIRDGKLTRAMIGLLPENLKEYQKKELKLDSGALVTEVPSDGPAAAAGIKVGDVVVRVGKTAIHNQVDLRNAMLVYAPGTTVEVEFVRDGKRQTANVKLVEYKAPASPAPGLPNDREFRFPRDFDDFLKDMPGDLFDRTRPKSDEKVEDVPPIRQGTPRLGVVPQNLSEELRKRYSIPANATGVVVTEVSSGSVAEKAGIRAGDVISSFDGKSISTVEDLVRGITAHKMGDRAKIKVERFGENARTVIERDIEFR